MCKLAQCRHSSSIYLHMYGVHSIYPLIVVLGETRLGSRDGVGITHVLHYYCLLLTEC